VTDVLLQAMDVTEQVRYRLNLEESDAAKSRFIAALSHEVRTPLTAILGYADMLAAELGGPLTIAQRHQVERVRASAWHTVEVLEQIVTYSRAATGALDLAPQPVDVCQVVRATVDAARADAVAAGVRFEIGLPRAGAHVVTDEARLRQIVRNLVSNAVRFTDGDVVRVSCRYRPEGCTVTVQDDGPGIPVEKREQIFELFQRDGIQHSDVAGTGLGLPVSRQLARLLGGDLTLDSAPGRGTQFTLRLPAADRPA
jgi:protein-histidine pros-kinase